LLPVYYTNAITESQAKKLGDYFKGDVFTDNSKIDIKIDKEKDIYLIFSVFFLFSASRSSIAYQKIPQIHFDEPSCFSSTIIVVFSTF
jgi:hypothetical protein